MTEEHMHYWFKPLRFWKCFALYYPVSKQGWIATGILFGTAVVAFLFVDSRSHSGSDTLLGFAPWAIALMAVFDLLCFRFGLYPSWWKKRGVVHPESDVR